MHHSAPLLCPVPSSLPIAFPVALPVAPSSGPFAAPCVAGLVLAAGLATRMGCPKLLLPLGQRPMLSYALSAALDAPLHPVLVVTGPHSPKALQELVYAYKSLTCVHAPHAATGQAASLKAGLAAVLDWEKAQQGEGKRPPVQGLCVLLGDQPLVRSFHVRLLLEAFGRRPEAFAVPVAVDCAEADAQGRMRRGNPVIIPRAYFGQVLALEGDTGARPLLSEQAAVQEIVMPDDAVLRDVDSPQDYESLNNF